MVQLCVVTGAIQRRLCVFCWHYFSFGCLSSKEAAVERGQWCISDEIEFLNTSCPSVFGSLTNFKYFNFNVNNLGGFTAV